MATIKDIAKLAEVNISTVSRALSGSSEVGEETREKIRRIAGELGYTPSYPAKALAGKSTKLIGIIVPEISSNYYAQIVNPVERKLDERGYHLIIGTTEFDAFKERQLLEAFAGRKVDGVILVNSLNPFEDGCPEGKTVKCSFPLICMEPLVKIIKHDSITIDGEYGIRLAVEHLVLLGHRSVGFIGEGLSSRYRLSAFEKAVEACGLRVNKAFIKSGKERFELGGYLRMKELLTGKEVPTAVFAAYDSIAVGAMKALREAGLKIPGDISIVGYDNIRESEYTAVPLTTVFPPVEEMAEKGVNMLISRVENRAQGNAVHIVLKPGLVVRESTGVI